MRKSSPLEAHYYFHAPRGMGADPSDCVACKHEHPELEKKIENLSSRITQYSIYGIGFLVVANVLSEWAKKKFLRNPYSRYPAKEAKIRKWAKKQTKKRFGKNIPEFSKREWKYVSALVKKRR